MRKFVRLLFLLLFAGITPLLADDASGQSQGIAVTGTISDDKGEPMIGVNVIVKGTTTGVVTDFNGKYSITVPNADAVLVFSFVGYVSQEVVVGAQRNINVQLAESTLDIEEVVVIGYGSVRKVDLAGSVSVLDNKNFKDQPMTDLAQALQGRMAGVQVENSGVPGGSLPVEGCKRMLGSKELMQAFDGAAYSVKTRETGVISHYFPVVNSMGDQVGVLELAEGMAEPKDVSYVDMFVPSRKEFTDL